MIFQINMDDMEKYAPFILASLLLVGGIILLKIALVVTKAEEKTDMKWVVGSFFIQFGITIFVSLPMLLGMIDAMISRVDYRPDEGVIALIVIFSTFIVLNLINVIHKTGLRRSFIVAILILGPIVGSTYLIFSNLGTIISF